MTMLADRIDGFALAVRGRKTDIGRIIEANVLRWVQAGHLPSGQRELDQGIIRDQVLAQVDERISGCVREIGGLRLLPADLPTVADGAFPGN
jgi:hypothetical protein